MGIALSPARAQNLSFVGLVVAIGVLEEQNLRRLRDDHAAVGEHQAGRDIELVYEDGELVRAPVAVGVLEDANAIVAGIPGQWLVRVVEGLGNPHPSALVERKRDRFDDIGFGGEEVEGELGRNLHELHRLVDGERQLVLGRRIAVLVVRHAHAVDVGDRGDLELLERHARGLGHTPDDRALDERLKPGIVPGPLVVAIRRVEDAALALRAHPRPWAPSGAVGAFHQHGAVGGVLLREGNGLVPCGEGLDALHCRV